MSRRSSRRAPLKQQAIPPSVLTGLTTLVEGNEATIASMMSLDAGSGGDALVGALVDVMGVNALSAEALLARFFDTSLLGAYCADRLGKSGKGNAATYRHASRGNGRARVRGQHRARDGASSRLEITIPALGMFWVWV